MTEGTKYDEGKVRLDLLPIGALWELGRVYTYGATKYAERNWEKGLRYSRVFGALLRHLWTWWRGERDDTENRCHHLASVAWCALALLHYELHEGYETYDDRPIHTPRYN